MNKQDVELILDNLTKWKAVPMSCLKKIKKELADPEKCQVFINWFQTSPIHDLLQERALVPEFMWQGYELMQMRDLREQDIFYDARRKMVAAFKAKYPARLLKGGLNIGQSVESSGGSSDSATSGNEGCSDGGVGA